MLRRRSAATETQSSVLSPQSSPTSEAGSRLLRRVRWTVLRPIAERFGGDERSLLRGPGMELAEVREYQPGDDVRHIDWNVTARTQTTYVRETQAERALDAWLLVDVSASLDWGTAACLKRDRAAEFVAAAGHLLGGRGNQLGAIYFAHQPLGVFPPLAGQVHLTRMLAGLRDMPAPVSAGPTDLAGALAYADRVIRRRSVAVVVSDFLAPDGWATPLRRLAARHEVVAVRLTDPRETELPDVGLLTLEDPETGGQLIVDTGDKRLRARFQAAAQAQNEQVKSELAGCGVDLLTFDTGAEILPPLLRFLDSRRRQRARRGAPVAAAAPTGGAA